jgi:alkanesulfonate monooxygenase SsuD/methylene tetrahydromethanopterin reductase-like flavin-dependent oxidoreductase (luciferase family)
VEEDEMKFGLLYIPDYYPERYPSASHYYGEMLEQIQYEEQLGFEGVFVAEHYLGGYAFPSPAVFAAAVAQRTQRMRIGIGVSLLPLHNPIRLAEEYAMLDALSDGRLDFGIGRGVLKAEYELFGIDEAESQGRFHEALEVILQAWTQDTVSYDGRYYSFRDVTALPKPVQRPYPPIWAACMVTPGSFTWAGQKGFHLMVPPFAYPEHAELQAKLAFYWEALKAAGHDPRTREVLGVYHLYVADTDAEAHAVAKEHFFRYFDFFAGIDQRAAWQAADYQRYQGGLSKLFGAITYDELDAGDCIIFGSPERCVQRLKRAQADYGLTYAIFEVNFGGLPHQKVMHSLERFAKGVMPHLQ